MTKMVDKGLKWPKKEVRLKWQKLAEMAVIGF